MFNIQNSIDAILNHPDCTQKIAVQFAYHCALELDKYYNISKYKEVKKTRDKCLELIASWLIDSNSVTKKELNAAATAAYAAANAAAVAADDKIRQIHLKSLLYYLIELVVPECNNSLEALLYKGEV